MSEVIPGRRELEPHLKARAAEILGANVEWLFKVLTVIPPLIPRGEVQSSAVAVGAHE